MSEILVNTIKKADGTGNLSVPAETGTLVIKDASNDVTLNDITAGGIYLGGTGAANKLEDYEEGTWTVNFKDESGNVSSSTSTGRYTKIGDVVHFFLQIESISTTGLTNTGSDGEFTLPFTPDGTSTFPSVHMANVDFAADQIAFAGYVLSANPVVRVASIRDNSSGIGLTVSQISGGNVRITGHYYAA